MKDRAFWILRLILIVFAIAAVLVALSAYLKAR